MSTKNNPSPMIGMSHGILTTRYHTLLEWKDDNQEEFKQEFGNSPLNDLAPVVLNELYKRIIS